MNEMVRTVYIFMIVVSLLSFIFVPGPSFSAEGTGIDVVLVMDSSGSMKKNDPLFLRIPAAKMLISLLGSGDRAAVVSFSDRGYPIRYLTPVGGSDKGAALLKAVDRISSKGMYTNLYDALATGLKVLMMDRGEERVGIIVLMSDGVMDVGDPEEDERFMGKINGILKDMGSRGVRVYTIAFTDQSDHVLLRRIAKTTGGFHHITTVDKDFQSAFTSIFEGIKMPDMLPLEDQKFLIDGSVREVTIVASKGSQGVTIALQSPGGNVYSYSDKTDSIAWFQSPNFDMITVKEPVEGLWKIMYSEGNDRAYIITDLKLAGEFKGSYVIRGQPVNIEAWLEMDERVVRRKEVLTTTDISFVIFDRKGGTLDIDSVEVKKGVYSGQFVPVETGRYALRVRAKGKTFERERVFDFEVYEPETDSDSIAHEGEDEQLEVGAEVGGEDEKVSWLRVMLVFVLINIVVGASLVSCMKRERMKVFLKRLTTRWRS